MVVSVVHTPLDARIHFRQIAALASAGWRVTQVAPWSDYGIPPPAVPPRLSAEQDASHPDRFRAVDVPRACGRRRLAAVLAARRTLNRLGPEADVVVVHDPELLLAVAGRVRRGRLRGGFRTRQARTDASGADTSGPAVVWDVHEDTAAALTDKPWLPSWLRPAARSATQVTERWAEKHLHLLLAEHAYKRRFACPHPVVPNVPVVPSRVVPPDENRVVYLGRISAGRGVATLLVAAELLAGEVTVELIGPADEDVRPAVERAAADGTVIWHGFLPNDQALNRVDGSLAGLSLLRDEPNYRQSLPTKVVEYLARGVPVITTPLPAAATLVDEHRCGWVVGFDDPAGVADAVRRLRTDPSGRRAMASRGREAVRRGYSWQQTAVRFVSHLETWAHQPVEKGTWRSPPRPWPSPEAERWSR